MFLKKGEKTWGRQDSAAVYPRTVRGSFLVNIAILQPCPCNNRDNAADCDPIAVDMLQPITPGKHICRYSINWVIILKAAIIVFATKAECGVVGTSRASR